MGKTFEIQGWRPRIYKIFEIPRTIYSNSERSWFSVRPWYSWVGFAPIFFSNLNSNCFNSLDMRNFQEEVKKALCYQKLFWPFTVWINCSRDLKRFANSRPSASNFKSFSQSLEHFFLTVGQNNFVNKIPVLLWTNVIFCFQNFQDMTTQNKNWITCWNLLNSAWLFYVFSDQVSNLMVNKTLQGTSRMKFYFPPQQASGACVS